MSLSFTTWFGLKSVIKYLSRITPGYTILIYSVRKCSLGWRWLNRIPVPLPHVIVCCSNLTISMCNPDRCEITKQLFWTRGARVPRADQIALEVFISFARKSQVIFDIGSSTGIFSIFSAKANPAADIYAFDIVPAAIDILQKILSKTMLDE